MTMNMHPYEEIYATRSEISTMDSAAVRFVTASGTLKRYHRNSGLNGRRLSNFSSIYAEISETGDRRSLRQILSNSFVDGNQNLLKFAKGTTNEEKVFRVNSKLFNDESGWTENILYEPGSLDYETDGDMVTIKRRNTMAQHVIGKARYVDIVRTACHRRRKTM